MGAPVMALCRVADIPIRVREPVTEPDAVVVADATLLHHVQLFAGLGLEGYVLINSTRSWDELGLGEMAHRHYLERLATIPATDITRRHTGRPLPNACLLGGLAALTRVVSIDALERAVREPFTGAVAAGNVAAARAAYDYTRSVVHAKAVGGIAGDRRGGGAVPAAGRTCVPDHAADAHRRGDRRDGA
jgi:pyruvate ferredoxin oxidoreductase gamma subunit